MYVMYVIYVGGIVMFVMFDLEMVLMVEEFLEVMDTAVVTVI
jgi:hypothetical protein